MDFTGAKAALFCGAFVLTYLRDEKPGHPYLEQTDADFVESLRGWRRDRQTGDAGLTIAGLLANKRRTSTGRPVA